MSDFTFNAVPTIKRPRSRFPMNHSYKTAFNMADLIPHFVQEVYPGDTFKVRDSFVIRTSVPFVRPIMDNLFADVYYFFVPNRLIFDDWEEFMGDNKTSAWKNTNIYTIPEATGNVVAGSLADYFGIPLNNYETNSDYLNELPFRAYAKIYDDWFRNENYQDPIFINMSSGQNKNGKFNNNPFAPNNIMGMPAKINKLKDYFTSVLPAPQKSNPVNIQFGLNVQAPVMTQNAVADNRESDPNSVLGLKWSSGSDGTLIEPLNYFRLGIGDFAGYNGTFTAEGFNDEISEPVRPRNLFANLSNINIANVNDLRYAFALQRLFEKDAIYGTRYTEMLEGHFGVTNPDARLQRSEYLSGARLPLQLSQVASTNGASAGGIAQVSAYSLTNGKAGFSKAFTEHGFVIGLIAVRQLHTYQQGLEKFWFRRYRSDFYDPVFAHIGYQPIYKNEIYAQEALSGSIWGYNQAWNDLRFRTNKITGLLRSDANEGLDIW